MVKTEFGRTAKFIRVIRNCGIDQCLLSSDRHVLGEFENPSSMEKNVQETKLARKVFTFMPTFDNHQRIRETLKDDGEECRICLTCSDGIMPEFNG